MSSVHYSKLHSSNENSLNFQPEFTVPSDSSM
jgi:hypothetical protein